MFIKKILRRTDKRANTKKEHLKTWSEEDLFLNNDSFITAYHISLVIVQANYCNNNLLILDIKQLNKIMKFYYFHTLKALWDGQGKIKVYHGIARFKEQLSRKSSSHMNFCEMLPVVIMKTKTKSP